MAGANLTCGVSVGNGGGSVWDGDWGQAGGNDGGKRVWRQREWEQDVTSLESASPSQGSNTRPLCACPHVTAFSCMLFMTLSGQSFSQAPHATTAHAHLRQAHSAAKASSLPSLIYCHCTCTQLHAPTNSDPTPHLASTAKTCCHTAAISGLLFRRVPCGSLQAKGCRCGVSRAEDLVPPLPQAIRCHRHRVPPVPQCRPHRLLALVTPDPALPRRPRCALRDGPDLSPALPVTATAPPPH